MLEAELRREVDTTSCRYCQNIVCEVALAISTHRPQFRTLRALRPFSSPSVKCSTSLSLSLSLLLQLKLQLLFRAASYKPRHPERSEGPLFAVAVAPAPTEQLRRTPNPKYSPALSPNRRCLPSKPPS